MASTLSQNLHKMMLDQRLSASELGRRIDMPAVTIKKIRTGENGNPTLGTLVPIANYFKVSVSQLVGDTQYLTSTQSITNAMGQKVNLIPVIAWEETLNWPKSEQPKNYQTVAWQGVSESAYALSIDTSEYEMFRPGGTLIIEPQSDKSKYDNHQYVLVLKDGNTRPSIKRVLEEDGSCYLQSVISNISNVVKFSDEYKIIGAILAYEIKL